MTGPCFVEGMILVNPEDFNTDGPIEPSLESLLFHQE